MGRVIGFAREMIADHGVAVILVHHTPKGDAATPRGHGSLHGDADVGLALSRDEKTSDLIRATFTKNRNGPSDGVLAFTIRTVTLEEDDDGDPITAAIADPADDPGRPAARLTGQARTARGILWDLIADEGVALPDGPGFPSSPLRGVLEARWRAECDARRLATSDDKDARAKAFNRAYATLKGRNLVAARDPWVWPVSGSHDDV